MNIVIVGATGNVGRKMLEVLEQKKLPIDELYLVASSRSAGKKLSFNNYNDIFSFYFKQNMGCPYFWRT